MKVTYEAIARHSGYWILVVLDLSDRSKADRTEGLQFKNFLKQRGFQVLQPSLYAKFAFTEASADSVCNSVLKFSPKKGKMTVLRMTDLQFQCGNRIVRGKISPMPAPRSLITIV